MDCLIPNGSLMTFPGIVAKVQQIGDYNESVAALDVTPLGQAKASHKLMKFSQRVAHESIAVQIFFHPSQGIPAKGVVQTFAIIYPDGTYELTGNAAIVSSSTGEMVSDEVQIGTLELMFEGGDGATAPVLRAT